jgi:hypothetical protein
VRENKEKRAIQYKTFSNKHLLTDALGELPARTVLRKEQWERKGGKQALFPEQSLFLKPTTYLQRIYKISTRYLQRIYKVITKHLLRKPITAIY